MEDYKLIEAKYSPAKFAEYVLGLDVKPFHKEWLDLVLNNRYSVITAPRGHGKTFMLGVVYPLWIVTYQHDKQVMIVGEALDRHAKPILKQIKNMIHSTSVLSDLVPKEASAVWSKEEIDLSTGSTIFVRPNTSSIRGSHVDYVICDEVSLYQDHDVFYSCIIPATTNKKGKICSIGTPMTDLDLLAELHRNEQFASAEYAAIVNPGEKNQRPLWPERFPLDELANLRLSMGNLKFEREYMCKKIPSETQLLPMEILESNFLLDVPFVDRGEDQGIYFVGGDLAISQEKSADQTVFTVVEKKDGYGIIREIKRMKGAHIKEQKFTLRRLCDRFNPRRILLDKATFGESMVQEMRQEGIPVYGYSFDSDSRMDLLNNMIALFDGMKLKIPRSKACGRTIQHTNMLLEELTALGTSVTNSGQLTYKSFGRHPDYSMSLALACMPLKNLRQIRGGGQLMLTSTDSEDIKGGLFLLGGDES